MSLDIQYTVVCVGCGSRDTEDSSVIERHGNLLAADQVCVLVELADHDERRHVCLDCGLNWRG